MLNIIILGYEYDGMSIYEMIKDKYNLLGFADISQYKIGMKVDNKPIYSVDDLILMKDNIDFSVMVANWRYINEVRLMKRKGIKVDYIWLNEIQTYNNLKITKFLVIKMINKIKNKIFKMVNSKCTGTKFKNLDLSRDIKLYAGDVVYKEQLDDADLYGLSINKADRKHIFHDITSPYPLPDNCIALYQAEDVLEHIAFEKIVPTINEIYRILKPGAIFRISLPDYYSPYLRKISMTNEQGEVIFDATGGGEFGKNGVEKGGHLWFPNYHIIQEILGQTKFDNYDLLCYRTEKGVLHKKEIDFTKGHVKRVDGRDDDKIKSMVIDCYK